MASAAPIQQLGNDENAADPHQDVEAVRQQAQVERPAESIAAQSSTQLSKDNVVLARNTTNEVAAESAVPSQMQLIGDLFGDLGIVKQAAPIEQTEPKSRKPSIPKFQKKKSSAQVESQQDAPKRTEHRYTKKQLDKLNEGLD